jgi:hypothetical protein
MTLNNPGLRGYPIAHLKGAIGNSRDQGLGAPTPTEDSHR